MKPASFAAASLGPPSRGEPLDALLDGWIHDTMFRICITFYTNDDGCGPGSAGGAGINIDDMWLEGYYHIAVEQQSWGRIKALYR